jgi:carboxyl-terminal processing protease
MTAWTTLCRVGNGTALFLLLLVAPFSSLAFAADEPSKSSKSPIAKQTATQLRATAEAAEKAGDWDAAFTAYCHLFVADRNASDVREKLNTALRRAQQLRRHRDPQFQRFVATTSVSDALNLFGEVISKVPVLYVERDRSTPQLLWESGIDELSRALKNPTFRQVFLDSAGDKLTDKDKLEEFRASLRVWAKQPVTDARTARTTLRKLISSAQDAFNIRVPSALVLEMVCGACSGLDEYTVFLSPSQLNPDSVSAIPDLSAQGVYLAFTDGGLVVSGVAFGSWAALHTELHKGDRIARLNGRSMDMATPASAAEALRAVDGLTHTLEIATGGTENFMVLLPVTVPTVYGPRVVNMKDGVGVGYARIGSFGPNTPRELDDAINMLKTQQGVRVMILDLRGNMGGSFLASVETAKRLIPSGLIVTTQGQLNEVANQPFSSDSGMTAHDIPVVVLIDAETASAAEVLAAALKDNNRATLIGMPTFGKGAIQYPLKLVSLDDVDEQGKPRTNRSGTVRLTIAKLIAPRGGTINGVGIPPHILEADPVQQLNLAIEKAIELLPSAPRPLMTSPPVDP